MKEYIRKRVLDICQHILDSKNTVRQAAVVFNVSKSTVHKDQLKVNDEKGNVLGGFIKCCLYGTLIHAESSSFFESGRQGDCLARMRYKS